jgi:hypothetical protein
MGPNHPNGWEVELENDATDRELPVSGPKTFRGTPCRPTDMSHHPVTLPQADGGTPSGQMNP